MSFLFILMPILVPILFGLIIIILHPQNRKLLIAITSVGVVLNSIIIFLIVFFMPDIRVVFFSFSDKLVISLGSDGMSRIFSSLIAIMWPLTAIYSFEYMKHEGKEIKFYSCFLITYGVVSGIAFSDGMITMYFFYELMTLITLPMVMHSMDKKAIYAGKKYLILSMTGAALAFISLVMVYNYCNSFEFVYGGSIINSLTSVEKQNVELAFILGFFGFGVKAAIFPFSGWLPAASVAPTPVSALLHAVAVVKGGVFAIIRLIYWFYGVDVLSGGISQKIVIIFASITIVYGSSMALLTQHLKRRLAFSTISQLSYIILAAGLMSKAGLTAGLTHMFFHAFIKITLFFCAGAILYASSEEYIYHMKGAGKSMPYIYMIFSVMGLALVGIPPLGSFISKYSIGMALGTSRYGVIGGIALVISGLLTLFYMVSIIAVVWFPEINKEYYIWEKNYKTSILMSIPIGIITLLLIILSFNSDILINVIDKISMSPRG